jgi:hypothetical protein
VRDKAVTGFELMQCEEATSGKGKPLIRYVDGLGWVGGKFIRSVPHPLDESCRSKSSGIPENNTDR